MCCCSSTGSNYRKAAGHGWEGSIFFVLQVAPAPFQRCKVLQLMPHISITNRTGIDMTLCSAHSPAPPQSQRGSNIMLTSKSHGELLSASPLPEVSDSSPRKPLPAGVVGALFPLLLIVHHAMPVGKLTAFVNSSLDIFLWLFRSSLLWLAVDVTRYLHGECIGIHCMDSCYLFCLHTCV